MAVSVSAPLFKGMGLLADMVTNQLAKIHKREVLRQMPQRFLDELAKIKIELVSGKGTQYERTKTISNLRDALNTSDVKVLSYVKKCDHTAIGGRIQTDIVCFGIEDMDVAAGQADDWKEVIVTIRYYYNAEGTAPEYILISVDGSWTYVKVYDEGVLVHESVWDDALQCYHTHYWKQIPL